MSPKSLRLAVLIVVVGVLAVVVVQNLAPVLPLTVLGARTLAYPLGLWLAASAGLGALTALGLAVLMGATQGTRRRSQKYRPRSFYEPPSAASAAAAADPTPSPDGPTWDEAQGDWQDWNRATASEQWQSWDQVSAAPTDRAAAANSAGQDAAGQGFSFSWRRRRPSVEQQVADTMADIDQGWDGDDGEGYRENYGEGYDAPYPPNDGWQSETNPDRPTQVYADGAIHSHRYGTQDTTSAPPPSAPMSSEDSAAPLDPPQVAQDGVVDADYRVIVPPSRDLGTDGGEEWDTGWDDMEAPPHRPT